MRKKTELLFLVFFSFAASAADESPLQLRHISLRNQIDYFNVDVVAFNLSEEDMESYVFRDTHSREAVEAHITRTKNMNKPLFSRMSSVDFTPALNQLQLMRLDQRTANILAAYDESVSSLVTPQEKKSEIIKLFTTSSGTNLAQTLVDNARALAELEQRCLSSTAPDEEVAALLEQYKDLRLKTFALAKNFQFKLAQDRAADKFLADNPVPRRTITQIDSHVDVSMPDSVQPLTK